MVIACVRQHCVKDGVEEEWRSLKAIMQSQLVKP
jgi:hypothetical protein